jgi:hypothetical protein
MWRVALINTGLTIHNVHGVYEVLNAPILFPVERCVISRADSGTQIQLHLKSKYTRSVSSIPQGTRLLTNDGSAALLWDSDTITDLVEQIRNVSKALYLIVQGAFREQPISS